MIDYLYLYFYDWLSVPLFLWLTTCTSISMIDYLYLYFYDWQHLFYYFYDWQFLFNYF